jgi:hypothetical protein
VTAPARPPYNYWLPIPHARSFELVAWETFGGTSSGTLPAVSCTFSDDGGRNVQQQLTAELAFLPEGVEVGMWVQAYLNNPLYDQEAGTPVGDALMITAINRNLSRQGGASITAEEMSVVLNGRPYEADTSLTGTLRTLVAECCNVALNFNVDVSQVPTIALPADSIAEFGAGRWDTCVKMADALGVVLTFDGAAVRGRMRNALAPAPRGDLTPVVVPPGGVRHFLRTPTGATVLVTRGGDVPPLTGRAVRTTPAPAFYLPYVITDRQEGDALTTQAQADQLARDLLTAQMTGLDAYTGLSVLPVDVLLDAGWDTATLEGELFWIRALTITLPELTMTLTLRAVVEA